MHYRARRPAAITLIALLSVFAAACGGGFLGRADKALATALVATDAARDEFVAWDKAHQEAIVATAVTRDEADDALRRYRAKRGAVLQAFVVAYTSIATAAAILPLVARGDRKEEELVQLLADAVTAAAAIGDAVQTFREGL